jgi:DEK-like protein
VAPSELPAAVALEASIALSKSISRWPVGPLNNQQARWHVRLSPFSSNMATPSNLILAVTVSSEVRESYTRIIDSILAASDLNTISEKRIRRGLQETVDYDLTPQKVQHIPFPSLLGV